MFKVNGRREGKHLKYENYFSESQYVNYKKNRRMKDETFKSNKKDFFQNFITIFYFQMMLGNYKTKLKEM